MWLKPIRPTAANGPPRGPLVPPARYGLPRATEGYRGLPPRVGGRRKPSRYSEEEFCTEIETRLSSLHRLHRGNSSHSESKSSISHFKTCIFLIVGKHIMKVVGSKMLDFNLEAPSSSLICRSNWGAPPRPEPTAAAFGSGAGRGAQWSRSCR